MQRGFNMPGGDHHENSERKKVNEFYFFSFKKKSGKKKQKGHPGCCFKMRVSGPDDHEAAEAEGKGAEEGTEPVCFKVPKQPEDSQGSDPEMKKRPCNGIGGKGKRIQDAVRGVKNRCLADSGKGVAAEGEGIP